MYERFRNGSQGAFSFSDNVSFSVYAYYFLGEDFGETVSSWYINIEESDKIKEVFIMKLPKVGTHRF